MSTNMIAIMGRMIVGIGAVGATATYIANTVGQQGVVTGILYVDEKMATEFKISGMVGSSIIVDGQVLIQGETIHGAEVVAIEKFCVEFEKNGIQWKQRVREKPNPAWEEP